MNLWIKSRTKRIETVSFIAVFVFAIVAKAQPTIQMEYKGYLEENGLPVNDEGRPFLVYFSPNYDSAWGDRGTILAGLLAPVPINNGHFTLQLTPLTRNIMEQDPLYLGILVEDSQGELQDLRAKQKLSAVPHAVSSRYATSSRQAEGSSSNFSVGRDLNVSEDAHIENDLTVGRNLNVTQNGSFTQDLFVNRNLNVTQNGTISQDLTVNRNFTVNQHGTIEGNLTVDGTSQLDGNVHIEGSDSTGPADNTVALKITSSPNTMVIDGNEIDSDGTLYIQNNTDRETVIGGDLRINGDIEQGISYSMHEITSNGDEVSQFIGSAHGRVCFFTFMHDSSSNHGECEVLIENNQWKLRADRNNNGAPRTCKVACLVWDSDED